ncbi:DUF6332 family protein [Streptomyces brasiliscabiei]|uniref:DUF6332 family protein n=1 Tax=Streptomyces brasiliscabiei TaxID=2736302 RepID=UPI001C103D33|nr:DUF6332 family protein [Streptomyces brasiliscabiei]
MGRRTQAERDAMTTEIGFALFAGTVLAGAAYFGVAEFLPDVVGSLRGRPSLLSALAVSTTVVVFIVVVTIVLTRFRRVARSFGRAPEDLVRRDPAQPSQPGRTNPDS